MPCLSKFLPVATDVHSAGLREGSIDFNGARAPSSMIDCRCGMRPAWSSGSIRFQVAPSIPMRITRLERSGGASLAQERENPAKRQAPRSSAARFISPLLAKNGGPGCDGQDSGERKRGAPTERRRRISKYHLVPPRFDHDALKGMIDPMNGASLAVHGRSPPGIPGIREDEKRRPLGFDSHADMLVVKDFNFGQTQG